MKPFALMCSLALAACYGTDNSPKNVMTISAFKVDRTGTCYPQLAGSDPLAVTPSFAPCPMSTDAPLVAGSDLVTIVVDYGDLEFGEGTSVPNPTVTLAVDGTPATTSIAFVQGPRSKGTNDHLFFEGTFTAPAQPGAQLTIAASATTGFSRTLEKTFALAIPTLHVSVEQCAAIAPPCHLTAAVDNAAIDILVDSTAAQTVTITSVVDGITQPAPVPVQVATATGTTSVAAVTYLLTPVGALWTVQATLNGRAESVGPITLDAPAVTAKLACASSCTAGTHTALTLTAPRRIHPAQGSVVVLLDGTPIVPGGTATLDSVDVPDGTVSGTLGLDLPAGAAGKTLVVNGSVAGYPFTTITTVLR